MRKFISILTIIVFIAAVATRLYALDTLPPSLYWEEAALGYDAYSIATTGRDHHGNVLPLVAFESFGDWKPSGYFYAIVPFIWLLDLTPLSVRLPSAIAGIFICLGCFYLFRLLIPAFITDEKREKQITQIAGYLMLVVAAFSPWAVIFSRAGWEANVATAFITWAVYFGLRSLENKKYYQKINFDFILTTVLLITSMYIYHSARIVAPFMGFILFSLFICSVTHTKIVKIKTLCFSSIVCFILAIPFIQTIGTPALSQRFAETSIFSDITIIEESNRLKNLANNSFISKFIYHRYILFGREIIQNYLSHFNVEYLFISSDSNPRHSTQYTGILYPLDALALILGLLLAFKRKNEQIIVILLWLAVSILPAALTKAAPHALRTLLGMPALLIVVSLGWYSLWQWFTQLTKNKNNQELLSKVFLLAFTLLALIQFSIFWRFYTAVYPKLYASEWQYGYQELYTSLNNIVTKDIPVYVSREYGRPAMYYWFFTKTSALTVQAEEDISKKDQGEFLRFKQYIFYRDISEIEDREAYIAVPVDQQTELTQRNPNLELIAEIPDINNEPLWFIYYVKNTN